MTLIFETESQHPAPSGRTPNSDGRADKWRTALNTSKSRVAQACSRLLPTRYAAAMNDEVFVLVRKHWGQVQTWIIPLPAWTVVNKDVHPHRDSLIYLIRRWSRLSVLGRMPTPHRVRWLVDSAFRVSVADHALPDMNPHKMRTRVKQLTASVVPCDLDTTFWSFTHIRQHHQTQVEAVSLAMIEVPRTLMSVMGGEIDQVIVASRACDQWQNTLPQKVVRRAATWHPLAQQALVGLFDESRTLKRHADEVFKIGKVVRVAVIAAVLYFSLGILSSLIEQEFFPRARQADVELADLQQQKIIISKALSQQSARDQQVRQQQRNQIQREQRTQRQSQIMNDVVALWASIPMRSQVEFLRWEQGRLTVQLLTRDVAEIERWRHDWSAQNTEHSPNMKTIHLRQIQKDRDAQWRVTVFLSS